MAEPRRANIEALRVERHHMTRTELAERVGTSYKHIYGIERGDHLVRIELLYKIADALDVTIDEVMVRTSRAAKSKGDPQPDPKKDQRKSNPSSHPEPSGPVPPPRKTKKDAATDIGQVA